MPIPDYQSLMLPVLVAASNGEVRIGSVVENLTNELGLTPEERAELLPSGKQTVFSNRVHWAKTYLAQAGLIEATRRGHFKISPRGQEVLSKSPSRIDNSFLAQFEEFRLFKDRGKTGQSRHEEDVVRPEIKDFANEIDTPDEIMRRAYKQIHSALARDLIDRIRSAPPEFFERLIVNLLISMGYGGANAEK